MDKVIDRPAGSKVNVISNNIREVIRPNSITRHVDIPFHVILNPEEVRNVFDGVDPHQVSVYRLTVDVSTFMPGVYFFIDRSKPHDAVSYTEAYYSDLDRLYEGLESFGVKSYTESIMSIINQKKNMPVNWAALTNKKEEENETRDR